MPQLVHSIVPTGRAEVVVGESSVTKPNELLSERRWWGKHLLPESYEPSWYCLVIVSCVLFFIVMRRL